MNHPRYDPGDPPDEPDRWHGGPAFPGGEVHSAGMSLRDWFAGMSLSALLPQAKSIDERSGEDGIQAKAADYARVAYAVADAMLRRRER